MVMNRISEYTYQKKEKPILKVKFIIFPHLHFFLILIIVELQLSGEYIFILIKCTFLLVLIKYKTWILFNFIQFETEKIVKHFTKFPDKNKTLKNP